MKPNAQKLAFPAGSRASSGVHRETGMSGWRGSADRTCLQPNSLQTGNFTGKITILRPQRAISKEETAVPQGLFSKFPKQTIREIFPKNREF
jgi:hypothetical protein